MHLDTCLVLRVVPGVLKLRYLALRAVPDILVLRHLLGYKPEDLLT